MAKLTNVKTVDMVNGEITKVAYDGAEYAKVEGNAKIGDLVLCVNNTPCFTVGEFYLAWDLYGDGGPRMKDDVGDNYHMRPSCRALFRKISAKPSPTLEERVTDLETEVASLKSEKESEPKRLTVGDTAKVIAKECMHKASVGDIVKIENDAKDRQPYRCTRISDGKDVGWFFESELEAYAEEAIEFEGATYRKVDREAREGDVVIFRKNTSNCSHINKPYLVTEVIEGSPKFYEGDRWSVYFGTYGRTRKTVDVYEPIEQAKCVPQVGDIVVVTGNTSGHSNSVGDIGKVGAEKPLGDGGVKVYVPGNSTVAIRTKPQDIRKATPAEVEAYEKAAHKASFAVGDYVKVTDDFCDKVVSVGDICEIVHDDGSNLPFKLKRLTDGKVSGYMYAHGLVKATDAEIAKATAPKLKAGDFVKIVNGDEYFTEETYEVLTQNAGSLYVLDDDGDKRFNILKNSVNYEIVDAETAKWAKIGRKVNEFKGGDVVRVIKDACAKSVGTIFVAKHANERVIGCDEGYGYDIGKHVELVAPVESTVA